MIDTEADLKYYQHASDRGGGGVMVRDDDRDCGFEGVDRMSDRCRQQKKRDCRDNIMILLCIYVSILQFTNCG